jgi:hypothetical protein
MPSIVINCYELSGAEAKMLVTLAFSGARKELQDPETTQREAQMMRDILFGLGADGLAGSIDPNRFEEWSMSDRMEFEAGIGPEYCAKYREVHGY